MTIPTYTVWLYSRNCSEPIPRLLVNYSGTIVSASEAQVRILPEFLYQIFEFCNPYMKKQREPKPNWQEIYPAEEASSTMNISQGSFS